MYISVTCLHPLRPCSLVLQSSCLVVDTWWSKEIKHEPMSTCSKTVFKKECMQQSEPKREAGYKVWGLESCHGWGVTCRPREQEMAQITQKFSRGNFGTKLKNENFPSKFPPPQPPAPAPCGPFLAQFTGTPPPPPPSRITPIKKKWGQIQCMHVLFTWRHIGLRLPTAAGVVAHCTKAHVHKMTPHQKRDTGMALISEERSGLRVT